ncbi:MAG: hypothetical protein IE923_05665 [Micrococcales bacterium]|nr:hypothetical protein [Micrococcales bacterium]
MTNWQKMLIPSRAKRGSDSAPLSVGARTLGLLADPSWIHRRVETVTMRADGETRRQVSFDVTLPMSLHIHPDELTENGAQKSAARVVVPLGFMRKGTLVDLDVSDATGRAVPVLSLGQNGELVLEAMSYLVRRLGPPSDFTPALRDVIFSRVANPGEIQSSERARRTAFMEIAKRSVDDSDSGDVKCLPGDQNVQQLVMWLRTLLKDSPSPDLTMLASLLAAMSEDYVFAVEVDGDVASARMLLKVSYASRVQPLKRHFEFLRHSEAWQLGIASAAATSTHLEIETTPGVQVSELRVIKAPGVTGNPFAHTPAIAAHRVHVFTSRRETTAAAFTRMRVTVMPTRQGALSFSLSAAIANFATQALLFFTGKQIIDLAYASGGPASEVAEHLGPLRDTTAAAIVALALSLAAATLVVVQYHDVERKVSAAPRGIILASALFFALSLASWTFHSWTPQSVTNLAHWVQLGCLLASSLLAAWATFAWVAASPGRVEKRLLRKFDGLVEGLPQGELRAAGLAATESALFEGLPIAAVEELARHYREELRHARA